MSKEKNDATGRELSFSRMLNAPVDVVWESWTNPKEICHWWGPDKFRNTIYKMEVRTGGKWEMTMHSPDGTDFEIKSLFLEIIKHKKIVYKQLTHFKYIATIEFESKNDKTFISWKMLFNSEEELMQAAKDYGVTEGFKQNTARLWQYLQQQKISNHETN